MGSLASRFSPIQEESGTSSRPIAAVGMSPAEQQPADQREIQFDLLLPRLPTQPRPPGSESVTEGAGGDSQTGGSPAAERGVVVRVQRWPTPLYPRERFIVLQKWEGTVLSVDGDSFTATLRDLSDPRRPEEEATIPVEEVPDSDRPLLVAGGVFYWSLGYKVSLAGNRERVAALRFRRLPVWTEADLREVRRKANRLLQLFG